MATINAFEHVFPVIVGNPHREGSHTFKNVLGTAFSIGGGRFATAAHVMREAQEYESVLLGFIDSRNWHVSPIKDAESFEDYDLAIFTADPPKANTLRWVIDERAMLEAVSSVGFPYAFNAEAVTLDIRAFAGHIVSSRTFRRLKANPRAYELSFQCPRGLSGAPLILKGGNTVCGVVIGNQASEMLVFSDVEKIAAEKETIVQRYESLQFGIALTSGAVVDLQSKILGGPIRDHLVKHGLL